MPPAPPAWHILTCNWWGMSPEESTQLWGALARSRWSRPVALRQHLALVGSMRLDLDHLFLDILTPQETIRVIEDLVKEKQLRRHKATKLEEHILALVDATGQWKAEHLT
jgi:hypothetical protein